ncbi:MAG: hypothetical protein R3298_05955 [Gammaproteobacteria bacterium]|nr:hypothetical protein [Gammaproteobacteria bacterium]
MNENRIRAACLAGTVLAVLVAAIYAQSLGYGFLVFDDRLHVYGNDAIRDGLTPGGVAWALTTFDRPYYMPLTRLSWLLDASLFGMDATGFRAVNALLHWLNALLLFLVVRSVTGRAGLALAVAAVFAVHPQHVEAVAWVSQRKELLAGFFGLLAMLAYLGYARSRAAGFTAGRDPSGVRYAAALLCFLLSLAAKPTWILFPFLLIALDYWHDAERASPFRAVLRDKVPFLLVALLMLAVHVLSQGYETRLTPSYSLDQVAVHLRVLNAVVIYVIYLVTSLLPFWSSLYFPYPVDGFPLYAYPLAAAVLGAISLWVYRARSRRPYLLFGWAWFLVSLVPVIGLTGAGEAIMVGDRWTYLPHVGLISALVTLGASLTRGAGRSVTGGALAVVCLVLAAMSWQVTRTWQSDAAYWSRTLERTEGNHFAHFQMSDLHAREGENAEREHHLLEAAALKPDDPKYLLNLAIHLQNMGEEARARPYLERLLALERIPETYAVALGQLMTYRGDWPLAHRFFVAAVRGSNRSPSAQQARERAMLHLAILATLSGRDEDATEMLTLLVEVDDEVNGPACERLRGEVASVPAVLETSGVREKLEAICRPSGER